MKQKEDSRKTADHVNQQVSMKAILRRKFMAGIWCLSGTGRCSSWRNAKRTIWEDNRNGDNLNKTLFDTFCDIRIWYFYHGIGKDFRFLFGFDYLLPSRDCKIWGLHFAIILFQIYSKINWSPDTKHTPLFKSSAMCSQCTFRVHTARHISL